MLGDEANFLPAEMHINGLDRLPLFDGVTAVGAGSGEFAAIRKRMRLPAAPEPDGDSLLLEYSPRNPTHAGTCAAAMAIFLVFTGMFVGGYFPDDGNTSVLVPIAFSLMMGIGIGFMLINVIEAALSRHWFMLEGDALTVLHHRSPGSRPALQKISVADIEAIVLSSDDLRPYLRLLLRTKSGKTIQLIRDYKDGEKRARFFRTVLAARLAKRVGVTIEG